jgi:hypothetical protein
MTSDSVIVCWRYRPERHVGSQMLGVMDRPQRKRSAEVDGKRRDGIPRFRPSFGVVKTSPRVKG